MLAELTMVTESQWSLGAFEMVLLGFGALLTLGVISAFVFLLTRKDSYAGDHGQDDSDAL